MQSAMRCCARSVHPALPVAFPIWQVATADSWHRRRRRRGACGLRAPARNGRQLRWEQLARGLAVTMQGYSASPMPPAYATGAQTLRRRRGSEAKEPAATACAKPRQDAVVRRIRLGWRSPTMFCSASRSPRSPGRPACPSFPWYSSSTRCCCGRSRRCRWNGPPSHAVVVRLHARRQGCFSQPGGGERHGRHGMGSRRAAAARGGRPDDSTSSVRPRCRSH